MYYFKSCPRCKTGDCKLEDATLRCLQCGWVAEQVLNREPSEYHNLDTGELEDSDTFDIDYYIGLAEIDSERSDH